MKECPVCNTSNIDGCVCRNCGFDDSMNYEKYPTLMPISIEQVKPISILRKNWHKKQSEGKISHISFYIVASYYSRDEQEGILSFDHEEELEILRGSQLVDGEITWSDVEFHRIDDVDELSVVLLLQINNEKKKFRLVVDRPATEDAKWLAGIRLHNGDIPSFELMVGNKEVFECSDRFYLTI